MQIERVEVEPANITISGPKKRVEAVEAAITDPVDVSGAMNRGSFSRHAVRFRPADSGGEPRSGADHGHHAEGSGQGRRAAISKTRMTSQTRQLFGTDGIRGVAGEFPLTQESTYLIGRALGHDLIRSRPKRPSVVIGQDTRESSSWIADRVSLGLVSSGVRSTQRRCNYDAWGCVSGAFAGVCGGGGDFSVAQSVDGQRHQGFFRRWLQVARLA